MARQVLRGEIWFANLNPTRGHEQAGYRPVLIVSTDMFNNGPASLVIVIPLTTKDRGIPTHIRLDTAEGGISQPSFILCEAIRSITTDRLGEGPLGSVSPRTMRNVQDTIASLLEM
jgi:mRNA interferase MazF